MVWGILGFVATVSAGMQAIDDIDPGEPSNISFWLALELTQAASRSFWVNDSALKNMNSSDEEILSPPKRGRNVILDDEDDISNPEALPQDNQFGRQAYKERE